MAGFTKLFQSLLTSSIWQEDDKTRLLWITMLAAADADGLVEGTVPGLANLANISVDDCEQAIAKLEAPDRYSRTPDNEGRRIERADGGWRILNYDAYRRRSQAAGRAPYYRKWRRDRKGGAQQQSVARNKKARAQQSADPDAPIRSRKPAKQPSQALQPQPLPQAQQQSVARNTEAESRVKDSANAESCAEPPQAAASAPPILSFPVKGNGSKTWGLTPAKLAEYEQTFDGLDVLRECKRARQWCLDNPTKRKTARGMAGFLTRWLTRTNDSGWGLFSKGYCNGEARPQRGAAQAPQPPTPGAATAADRSALPD